MALALAFGAAFALALAFATGFADRSGAAADFLWLSCEQFLSSQTSKIPKDLPVEQIMQTETSALITLQEKLEAEVFGQDTALTEIVDKIIVAQAGLKPENKPIGSFVFMGPTGCGKTETAKALAKHLGVKLLRFDMSEYQEKHSISKLIGSPPGYVGYDEGGQLTEKIKNNPFSVILFDEIEKAHKDVFNLLLQILDEGHLTDSFGRKVDFTNTILIMTSNVGAKKVSDFGEGIGFSTKSSEEQKYEIKKTIIKKSLKQQFTPEFLNRIDDVILFNSLDENIIKKIIGIEVSKLISRLKDKNYDVSFDKSVINRIFELNSQEEYGARPLKRIIQNLLEDFLSEEILRGTIKENKQVTLKYKDDKLKILKK